MRNDFWSFLIVILWYFYSCDMSFRTRHDEKRFDAPYWHQIPPQQHDLPFYPCPFCVPFMIWHSDIQTFRHSDMIQATNYSPSLTKEPLTWHVDKWHPLCDWHSHIEQCRERMNFNALGQDTTFHTILLLIRLDDRKESQTLIWLNTNHPYNVSHSSAREIGATGNETENDCKVIARRNLQMVKGDVDLQLMNTSLLTGLDGGWWLTVTDWGAGNWVWLRARRKRDCKWKVHPVLFSHHEFITKPDEKEKDNIPLSRLWERDDFLLFFHCQGIRTKAREKAAIFTLLPTSLNVHVDEDEMLMAFLFYLPF